MSASTRPMRYTAVPMLLHWVLALAIFSSLAMGLTMTGLPLSIQRLKLYNWHKWAGVVILVLSVVRIGWALARPAPPLPPAVQASMQGWQMAAYRGTHQIMYALFILLPLAGWAYTSATGFPVVLFGIWPLPDLVPKDKALADVFKTGHAAMAYLLLGLVVLHVAAALKHHFHDRDGVLLRMWPQRAKRAFDDRRQES